MSKIWTQFNNFVLDKNVTSLPNFPCDWPRLIYSEDLILLWVCHWNFSMIVNNTCEKWGSFSWKFTLYCSKNTIIWLCPEPVNSSTYPHAIILRRLLSQITSLFQVFFLKCRHILAFMYVGRPIDLIFPNNILLIVWVTKFLDMSRPSPFQLLSPLLISLLTSTDVVALE
jgi:hypothetical protein